MVVVVDGSIPCVYNPCDSVSCVDPMQALPFYTISAISLPPILPLYSTLIPYSHPILVPSSVPSSHSLVLPIKSAPLVLPSCL